MQGVGWGVRTDTVEDRRFGVWVWVSRVKGEGWGEFETRGSLGFCVASKGGGE